MYYDKNGNLTKNAEGYAFFYDRGNQLTRIEDSGASAVASYAYDPLGRRIEMVDEKASETTRFYLAGDRVIEDVDDSAVVQRYYVWGNYVDELLLMWREEGATDGNYHALHDQIFSIAALVDQSDGSVVERYEYDAYGAVSFMDASYAALSPQASGVDNPYLFTGRQLDVLDSESFSIQYSRARYYDAATARWMQRDPIGFVDGHNLYQYVRSNPIGKFDPFGLMAGSDPLNFNDSVLRLAIEAFRSGGPAALQQYARNIGLSLSATLALMAAVQIHEDVQAEHQRLIDAARAAGQCEDPCKHWDNMLDNVNDAIDTITDMIEDIDAYDLDQMSPDRRQHFLDRRRQLEEHLEERRRWKDEVTQQRRSAGCSATEPIIVLSLLLMALVRTRRSKRDSAADICCCSNVE